MLGREVTELLKENMILHSVKSSSHSSMSFDIIPGWVKLLLIRVF